VIGLVMAIDRLLSSLASLAVQFQEEVFLNPPASGLVSGER
jgi:hypothetical protein